MEAIKKKAGKRQWAIFLPTNEWMQPVVLGLQNGRRCSRTAGATARSRSPRFAAPSSSTSGLFRDGLAPVAGNNDIANPYQEFARGTFAMWITGPWNIGEFERRLPPDMQNSWATAPLPGPIRRAIRRVERGRLEPRDVQGLGASQGSVAADRVSLPRRTSSGASTISPAIFPRRSTRGRTARSRATATPRAFYTQLQRVRPTPKVPEWELITSKIIDISELSIRGGLSTDRALAQLDAQVNRILEKRRWILARAAHAQHDSAAAVRIR